MSTRPDLRLAKTLVILRVNQNLEESVILLRKIIEFGLVLKVVGSIADLTQEESRVWFQLSSFLI